MFRGSGSPPDLVGDSSSLRNGVEGAQGRGAAAGEGVRRGIVAATLFLAGLVLEGVDGGVVVGPSACCL
jgi:hypothetical protein